MKTRKINRLLAPLAPAIEGSVADGQLKGTYRGYTVQARPHSGYPITYASSYDTKPAPAHMLQITLVGVAGTQMWHCQSSASSYLQDLASRFTSGALLKRFKPGQFKFLGADPLNDSMQRMGEKLVSRLGAALKANADPALQERLIAAGLFDELDALRLGAHPYLPRVEFVPFARELADQYYLQSGLLARVQPELEERLRAAGLPDDLQSLTEARLEEADTRSPGHLRLDVEAGKDGAVSAAQFGEVLERLVRIAAFNAEVNQRAQPH